MTEMEILYSDLHDIYDMLRDNGYGAWCRTIRKAVELLEAQETSDTNQSRVFHCKKCGYGIDDIFLTDEEAYPISPKYCPNCGRLVK